MQNANIEEYDFSVIEVIKKGFSRINGVKGTFIAAFVIYIIVAIVLQVVLSFIFPIQTNIPTEPNNLNQLITTIIGFPVLMPLLAGITMLAINHSRGKDIAFASIFNYYHLAGKLSLATIAMYVMMFLGFLLFIIPGIYLMIAYVFMTPLIVDKGMNVWEAMETSRKAVTKHWFKVFGLSFMLGMIMLMGAIFFGIGLIWAIPLMFVTLHGILYPLIFDGVEI
ncbi:MAG: hypothetical protein DRQ78_01470 [Epsilonproteobacteria bacterium]|nr:MAG: hypothetical protein DRQ78_01470 [Campylobacterota bacterium]